jgi:hypothetical protein
MSDRERFDEVSNIAVFRPGRCTAGQKLPTRTQLYNIRDGSPSNQRILRKSLVTSYARGGVEVFE